MDQLGERIVEAWHEELTAPTHPPRWSTLLAHGLELEMRRTRRRKQTVAIGALVLSAAIGSAFLVRGFEREHQTEVATEAPIIHDEPDTPTEEVQLVGPGQMGLIEGVWAVVGASDPWEAAVPESNLVVLDETPGRSAALILDFGCLKQVAWIEAERGEAHVRPPRAGDPTTLQRTIACPQATESGLNAILFPGETVRVARSPVNEPATSMSIVDYQAGTELLLELDQGDGVLTVRRGDLYVRAVWSENLTQTDVRSIFGSG